MSLKATAKTFAVIGDPVSQSKSPQMFNAAFSALKINARYEAHQVPVNKLKDFFGRMRNGEIAGANITIPHKQTALEFCDELSPFAQQVGAVNTVLFENKIVKGHNTDGPGYLNALKLIPNFNLKNCDVVVLGCGGAARAICFALCGENIRSLTLVNRTQKHAQDLAIELSAHFPKIGMEIHDLNVLQKGFPLCDLFVNTTSLSMANNSWPDLNFVHTLKKTAVVSDIVYKPHDTPLLVAAKKCGLVTHYGSLMLLHQAYLAFEIFLRRPAPQELMAAALQAGN